MSDPPKVTDYTELTKLVGPEGIFKDFVMEKFSTEWGSVRWRSVKDCYSKEEFVANYSDGEKSKRVIVEDWIEFHGLSDGFRAASPPFSRPPVEETTSGSTANPSRDSFMRLVEAIQNTKFNFILNKESTSTEAFSLDLLQNRTTASDCRELLGKSLDVTLPEECPTELNDLNFLTLQREGETTFQAGHLQTYFFQVDGAKALDYSKGTANGPFFKPAIKLQPGGDTAVSQQSAKIGGTSMVAPMDLEIKSDTAGNNSRIAAIDMEVLTQTVERISMKLHNNWFIRIALAFAVTGRSAWYLFAKRPDPLDKPTLGMHRIEHQDVGTMWMCATKLAATEPGFFLAEDGAALFTVIHKIGVTPWCCRIEALNKSQSIVYSVTVPRTYHDSSQSLTGIALDHITYAVKVIRDDAGYKKEAAALQKIFGDKSDDFHALGHVPCGAGEAVKFVEWDWDVGVTAEAGTEEENYWWRQATAPTGGGAIFMRCGNITAEDAFPKGTALPKSVCSNLMDSLRMVHSAGILHCDLRRSNFMQFTYAGGKSFWEVIDFSLSMEVGSEDPASSADDCQLEPGS